MENGGNNNPGQYGNNTSHHMYNSSTFPEASLSHAFGYNPQQHHQNSSYYGYHQQQPSCYGGAPPHVMCLKLGKRQYFEDTSMISGTGDHRHVSALPVVNGGPAARCSVEGCDVSLINAKEYHRRHKVCEMHSKAPRVVVLGLEQRFCQQCSRFHGISEFDDAKRSCRRRLAGHNERRRKISHDSTTKNHSHALVPERARSLLSLKSDHRPWVCPPDFSSRSSAALRELIAENRASRQHVSDHDTGDFQHQMYSDMSHKTLDLMQAPSSAFGLLSVREKAKEERHEECYEVWNNSLEGTLMM